MNTVRAVILDWAGTVVDNGSRAPVEAFTELFRRNGIQVDDTAARSPMGLPKKEHIRAILSLPWVGDAWKAAHGDAYTSADLDRLYDQFLPLQASMIAKHANMIPGAVAVVKELRSRGVRVGSTTGYMRNMMRDLIPLAARAGYEPDCTICTDEVPQGRPAPWMALSAAMRMGAYPIFACIKVGDTIADIAEGRNAGMWSVGISRTGNEGYVSPKEADSRFRAAKANYVIDDINGLPAVVAEISDRIAAGDRP